MEVVRGEVEGGRYFDSAATSFPKSPAVFRRVEECLSRGGSYGRSFSPRGLEAMRLVERTRELLASVLGTRDPRCVSFTGSATAALNTVLLGLDYPKGRVLISPLEHNAVARPLAFLRQRNGLVVESLPALEDGTLDLDRLSPESVAGCDLVVVNHASNVSGVVQPVGQLRARIGWGVPLLVDACQSAGHVAIEVEAWGVDWLACSGHKGLGGIAGLGCMYASGRVPLRPLIHGGTGMDAGDAWMPSEVPARFEAGTPNIVGIAGLLGALEAPLARGHDQSDYHWLLSELRSMPGLRVVCASDLASSVELCSLLPERIGVSDFAMRLLHDWRIETRVGLHCAWMAHSYYGTLPSGMVRLSLSPSHTRSDLELLAHAVRCGLAK